MANNIKLTVSVGRTINLGNYESLRLDEGATITIDTEQADPNKKYLELANKLEELVEEHGILLATKIKQRR